MPVQYEGVRPEHMAVRTHAGMFDAWPMGGVESGGPGARAFPQPALSNDVGGIGRGGARCSCRTKERGGGRAPLFTSRLGHDRYLPVTNAATRAGDLQWLGRHSQES